MGRKGLPLAEFAILAYPVGLDLVSPSFTPGYIVSDLVCWALVWPSRLEEAPLV